MALRIAVNSELEALRRLLDQMPQLLGPGAAATIISFHSLEDRMVKQAFAGWRRQGLAQLLTRKVVVAGADERRDNPRSRSAKLRAIRWLGALALAYLLLMWPHALPNHIHDGRWDYIEELAALDPTLLAWRAFRPTAWLLGVLLLALGATVRPRTPA